MENLFVYFMIDIHIFTFMVCGKVLVHYKFLKFIERRHTKQDIHALNKKEKLTIYVKFITI